MLRSDHGHKTDNDRRDYRLCGQNYKQRLEDRANHPPGNAGSLWRIYFEMKTIVWRRGELIRSANVA